MYGHVDCHSQTALLVEHAALPIGHPARERLWERLVVGFLPVAHNIARRFAGKGETRDDLEQVAALGLLRALHRFDPTQGTDFMSYAVPTIIGEVRHYFRDASWIIHFPRSLKDRHLAIAAATSALTVALGQAPTIDEIGVHLGIPRSAVRETLNASLSRRPVSLEQGFTRDGESVALGETMEFHDHNLENVEARVMVHDLVASLTERERKMLAMRFIHNNTQSEIAAALRISQNHVSRLLAATLARLREEAERVPRADPSGNRSRAPSGALGNLLAREGVGDVRERTPN